MTTQTSMLTLQKSRHRAALRWAAVLNSCSSRYSRSTLTPSCRSSQLSWANRWAVLSRLHTHTHTHTEDRIREFVFYHPVCIVSSFPTSQQEVVFQELSQTELCTFLCRAGPKVESTSGNTHTHTILWRLQNKLYSRTKQGQFWVFNEAVFCNYYQWRP